MPNLLLSLWVVQSRPRVYSKSSASQVPHWEECVDGEVFCLTVGSTWRHFYVFAKTACVWLFLHWSASQCYIQIYSIWCNLHVLDTCSLLCHPENWFYPALKAALLWRPIIDDYYYLLPCGLWCLLCLYFQGFHYHHVSMLLYVAFHTRAIGKS